MSQKDEINKDRVDFKEGRIDVLIEKVKLEDLELKNKAENANEDDITTIKNATILFLDTFLEKIEDYTDEDRKKHIYQTCMWNLCSSLVSWVNSHYFPREKSDEILKIPHTVIQRDAGHAMRQVSRCKESRKDFIERLKQHFEMYITPEHKEYTFTINKLITEMYRNRLY